MQVLEIKKAPQDLSAVNYCSDNNSQEDNYENPYAQGSKP